MNERESFAFIDLAKYLQSELNKQESTKDKYVVVNEKNDNVIFNGTSKIVVKALSSNTFNSSAELNYQLDILVDDVQDEINRLTKFVRSHNNTIINSIVPINENEFIEYKIYQRYTTPTAMQLNIENLGLKHYSRLVIFCTLVAMKDINDIVSVSVDNEQLLTLERSINYATETSSYHVQGKNLNNVEVKTSGVSIGFRMVNQSNSIFGRKMSAIRQGKLSKNTVFKVDLKMSDGTTETYYAKWQQGSINSNNGQLPGVSIILTAQLGE